MMKNKSTREKRFSGFVLLVCTSVLLTFCNSPDKPQTPFTAKDLIAANTVLLDAAMADVFTPPVASRIFAYAHLTHYLTYQSLRPKALPNIKGSIHDLAFFETPDSTGVEPELAALLAFSKMGKKLIYSEVFFDNFEQELKAKALKQGYTAEHLERSQAYAQSVFDQLSSWVDKDHYIETRTYPRYTSTKKPENWRETPPDYEAALEPFWDNIRPLVIDSLNVYEPATLPIYSTDPQSDFYAMVHEVYAESRNEEKEKIAWFWDCNPVLTIHQGHMIQTIHKYSPPGHWLNIVTQVTEQNNSDYAKATQAYTYVATAMFDAIIAVWHYKFKTDLVRPITYIQEFIDPHWEPILQTPPFPEYTSGHSAISGAAATVLSGLYGADSGFHDTTQLRFGLEERSFTKFMDAAYQVNLSRFYGGIHYKPGVEEGGKQGAHIGQLILNRFIN
jgi:hypothetical protein